MKNIYSYLLSLLISLTVSAQAELTPAGDLNLRNAAIEVPEKFAGVFPAGKAVNIPRSYQARVFYAGGLTKPRFIRFDPEGVLHVADMGTGGNGKIYALPDKDKDGVADTAIIVSQGYTNNHDVRFYKGAMYVTESGKIWKCTDADHNGIYETKTVFIDNIGGGNTSGHVTRTLLFDSIQQKAYVSIGSSCNVCREDSRAIIEQYNDDGTGKRTFVSGTRNAVGMALHPVTNRIWANNNGSDNQGNEIPPEWIDILRDGGFYGHPFAYGNKVWFDFEAAGDYKALKPITSTDSSRVNRMVKPAAMMRAHTAPMEIAFLNQSFSQDLRDGFLVALHGSWNTEDPNDFRGYKVIYANLSGAQDTSVNYVADFCEGFLTDKVNRTYWARPVGLAVNNEGDVFMSSDETTKFILQLYRNEATGLNQADPLIIATATIYPNPFSESFTISLDLNKSSHITIALVDILGKTVQVIDDNNVNRGLYKKQVITSNLPDGLYFLKINADNESLVKKIYVK